MAHQTEVVLLGTGTPNPDPRRMGSALAVVVGEQAYLVDFGPGVVRRAVEAYERGIAALQPRELNIAFLTHLHSDHTAGYPDLIYTPWVMGRPGPVQVYGPAGTANLTANVLAAYESDRAIRVDGLEPINEAGYGATAHEIGPGVCYEDERVRVEAFEVNHGEGWLALGFKFTTDDRTIVISGDTTPHEPVLQLWEGCDVLVHEVYSARGFSQRSGAWQRYHSQMHTSTEELATIANRVLPGKLVLTHQLFFGVSEAELVDEIRQHYDGNVICGEDLGVY